MFDQIIFKSNINNVPLFVPLFVSVVPLLLYAITDSGWDWLLWW